MKKDVPLGKGFFKSGVAIQHYASMSCIKTVDPSSSITLSTMQEERSKFSCGLVVGGEDLTSSGVSCQRHKGVVCGRLRGKVEVQSKGHVASGRGCFMGRESGRGGLGGGAIGFSPVFPQEWFLVGDCLDWSGCGLLRSGHGCRGRERLLEGLYLGKLSHQLLKVGQELFVLHQ